MILTKLVIGLICEKCFLTQIPQNKQSEIIFFFIVKMKIILPYILTIYQPPRLLFKNIGLYLDETDTHIKEKLS